jgi:hypothetical protein
VTDDVVEYDADPPTGETPPGSVRDLRPEVLTLAGVKYTFRCPKLAAWAEMAVPALSHSAGQRDAATTGAMVLFLHAALAPAESEALHMRKYDPDDPLDLPDLIGAFMHLVDVWRDEVQRLARAAGMQLELRERAKRPAEVVAPRGAPARRRAR